MESIFDQLTSANAKDQPEEKSHPDGMVHAEAEENTETQTTTPHHHTLNQIKEVSQQLLKHGLLESTTKQSLFQTAVTNHSKINEILEPLDLVLEIDDIRGLAFVVVANVIGNEEEDEQWSHPLVRRQRLNMEQSLLIAILRKYFIAHELEAGIGDNKAVIHLDELLPELNAYLGELGSEMREDKRLRNLLEQLKNYGIVTDINEHEQIMIRPLIAHVANPENLKNLLDAIKRKSGQTSKDSEA